MGNGSTPFLIFSCRKTIHDNILSFHQEEFVQNEFTDRDELRCFLLAVSGIYREYYGRSATEIQNIVDIRYNKQQPLIAFLYDDETMSVPALDDLVNSQTEFISNNDYVYYVAFEFCK